MRSKNWWLCCVAVLGMTAEVDAQQGRPFGPQRSSATFSPYLNMLGGGRSPSINYLGITRPEFQARDEFRNLQQQISENRRSINEVGDAALALPTTGDKPVSFLNTGGYFM